METDEMTQHKAVDIFANFQAFADDTLHGCYEWANEYGEPGYSSPERGIILANWNDVSGEMQDELESAGYSLEWSDEWTIDYDNGAKAYRTSPDSYGWESRVMYYDGGILTPDDDISDWIDQCANNPRGALPSWWEAADIAADGWQLGEEVYEKGFHPGQTDDPVKIAAALSGEGFEYLFQISGVGQLDVRFKVWVRKPESEDTDD